MSHLKNSTGNYEWFTPPHILQAVRYAFEGKQIGLDPCTTHEANRALVLAGKYFTKEDNALEQPWLSDAAFINPPYRSADIKAFSQKLVHELKVGNLTGAYLAVE